MFLTNLVCGDDCLPVLRIIPASHLRQRYSPAGARRHASSATMEARPHVPPPFEVQTPGSLHFGRAQYHHLGTPAPELRQSVTATSRLRRRRFEAGTLWTRLQSYWLGISPFSGATFNVWDAHCRWAVRGLHHVSLEDRADMNPFWNDLQGPSTGPTGLRDRA
jgi:hypothetical protein